MRRATSWTMLPTTCRRFCWAATTRLLAEIFWHCPFKCAGLRPELCCLLRAAAAGEQLLPAYLQKSSDTVPFNMRRATSWTMLPTTAVASGEQLLPAYLQKSSDTVPFNMRRATSWTMLPTTCRRCWWAATTCWPASSSSASAASSSLSPFVAASEAARSVTSYTNHFCFLKGQHHDIFCSMIYSWIIFPQAPDYNIRIILRNKRLERRAKYIAPKLPSSRPRGWPLLTVEIEVNGGSKCTNYRVLSWLLRWTRRLGCCSLVITLQNIIFPTVHFLPF